MLNVSYIKGWVVIAGIVVTQGCWENEQFTLLGEGGCRLADGGGGDPIYLAGLTSEQCQAQCFAENGECTAVEYNTNNRQCEVHSEPIVKFEGAKGVFCYLRN
jgi:PAN domain